MDKEVSGLKLTRVHLAASKDQVPTVHSWFKKLCGRGKDAQPHNLNATCMVMWYLDNAVVEGDHKSAFSAFTKKNVRWCGQTNIQTNM